MIAQTPGVYITEKNLLPNSVAGVSTAIPIFIGFTQHAATDPVRITSMIDFIAVFGGAYSPTYTVSYTNNEVASMVIDKRFFLYDSLHLYFRNGGGPCHIISAGTFDTSIDDFSTNFSTAIGKIETIDEGTLVLLPDLHYQYNNSGTLTSFDNSKGYNTTVNSLLNTCESEQDKFAILDFQNATTSSSDMRNWVSPFTGALKYGALYYPWLKNAETHPLDIDSIAGYAPVSSQEIRDINTDIHALEGNLPSGHTSTALLTEFNRLVAEYNKATNSTTRKRAFGALINFLTNSIKGFDLSSPSQTFSDAVSQAQNDSNLIHQIRTLYRLRNLLKTSPTFITHVGSTPANAYAASDDWYLSTSGAFTSLSDVESSYTFPDANLKLDPTGANKTNETVFAEFVNGDYVDYKLIFAALGGISETVLYRKQMLSDQLFSSDEAYIKIKKAVQQYMEKIPAQGAIAGIYCQNDRDLGVWKSPANVAVQGISGPMIEVSNAEQDGLNVDPATGKSINVIRTFTGRGTLVWGARTLEGNSNEWRYIAVRRFFNFAEDSIKKAMRSFVFEPNNARTWVKINAMVTSFLAEQWRAGALVGNSMEEAFFVRIGEETTSQTEILDGKINVQIGMAVARPAEFIILEFSHFTNN